MKNFKRILAMVLAVIMVVSVMMVGVSADDTKATYNATAIERLNKLGIFKGSTSGNMHADDDVTREQMALFTGRVMTGKTATNYWETYVNATTFEDIDDESAEFIGAIAYAYENGVVIGKSDVRFDPKGNVSYQDSLTMVVRALGYTGLEYPNGYINKAIQLGLTNGISGVAYKDNALRGVIATILYNALYAENSLFAKQFNLTSGTYVLVATPQFTTAYGEIIEAAVIGGYEGNTINAGYLAFAKIDGHGRIDHKTYEYVKTSEIASTFDTDFQNRLGYGYNLTFENYKLAWADACATKTFVNYGDNREMTSTAIWFNEKDWNGTAYGPENFLTVDGKVYNAVDYNDPDFKNVVGTQDIVIYAPTLAGTLINEYRYFYNASGDITETDGTTVILKLINGKYHAMGTDGQWKLATDEDYRKALQCVVATTKSDYTILDKTTVPAVYNNYFCELTMMDYDGDGEYDAAVYNPYYIGFAYRDIGTVFNVITDANVRASVTTSLDIRNFKVTGKVNALGAWGMYIFKFNRFNNEINVIEVVGKASGRVTSAKPGYIPFGGTKYVGSTVTIGDATYAVGGWDNTNLHGYHEIISFVGNNDYCTGWNDALATAQHPMYELFNNAYVLAGHLIYGNAGRDGKDEFVTFDPWDADYAINNDKIVVEALTDATGVYKTVTINSINGATFDNIELEAFSNYINAMAAENIIIKPSYFFNETLKAKLVATEAYKQELRKLVIKNLFAKDQFFYFADTELVFNAMYYADLGLTIADAKDKAETMAIFEVNTVAADGSLNLITEERAWYDPYSNYITFDKGISDKGLINTNTIIATDSTVFTFVCKDGIYTYTGKPADGWALNLKGAGIMTKILAASNSNIMIVANDRKLEEVAIGTADFMTVTRNYDGTRVNREHNNTWRVNEADVFVQNFFINEEVYLVTSSVVADEIVFDEETNSTLYVYTGLYDLVNRKADVTVTTNTPLNIFNGTVHTVNTQRIGLVISIDNEGLIGGAADIEYVDPAAYATDLSKLFALNTNADGLSGVSYGEFVGYIKSGDTVTHVVVNDGTADKQITVTGFEFVVVYQDTTKPNYQTPATNFVQVGDASKILEGADIFYRIDALTGKMVAYVFNPGILQVPTP